MALLYSVLKNETLSESDSMNLLRLTALIAVSCWNIMMQHMIARGLRFWALKNGTLP